MRHDVIVAARCNASDSVLLAPMCRGLRSRARAAARRVPSATRAGDGNRPSISGPLVRCVCAIGCRRAIAHAPPVSAGAVATPAVVRVARSAGRYDGSLRELIHAFKYEQPPGARASRWRRDCATAGAATCSTARTPWCRCRCIRCARLRRGFNQADDLARAPRPAGLARAAADASRAAAGQRCRPSRRHANVNAPTRSACAACAAAIAPPLAAPHRRAD